MSLYKTIGRGWPDGRNYYPIRKVVAGIRSGEIVEGISRGERASMRLGREVRNDIYRIECRLERARLSGQFCKERSQP